jgi:hypothetical protein
VHGLAKVNPIVQQPIEHALIEQVSVAVGSAGCDQLPSQEGRRLQLHESSKYRPDPLSVSVMDDELAIPDLIAERCPAAHKCPSYGRQRPCRGYARRWRTLAGDSGPAPRHGQAICDP